MTNTTSLYIILTVVICISLLFTIYTLIKLILKIRKMHRFRSWYNKKALLKNALMFLIFASLYILTLFIHATSQTPSTVSGVSQDAVNIFETSMLIYRSIFMYTIVTPFFLLTIYHLYKVIFIIVRLRKQKVDDKENNLLKAITDGNSKEICKYYREYINASEIKTTRFSYIDDTFILKCLDKNEYYELSTDLANIIEIKQKHKKYNKSINQMYLGDIA